MTERKAPTDYLKSFLNKRIIVHLRRPTEYKGYLREYDDHLNLKIADTFENGNFIGTVILNGGGIGAIECPKK